MKTIALGGSALQSSRLAYGCWRMIPAGKPGEIAPARLEDARQAIRAAFTAGYRLFDHADVYGGGLAEEAFGTILHEEKELRDQILIATKCGIRMAGDPAPEAPYRYDFSPSHIIASCEASLRRLRTDRIDLFLLHRPDYLIHPAEVAEAFAKLRAQGKVREFGLSNATPAFFNLLQSACPMRLIANQVEISLLKLDFFHNGTMEHSLAGRITPMAWSPLAAGRLSFSGPIDLNEPDHASRIRLRDALDAVARPREVSRSVIALAWLLRHPSGIVPIVGTTDPLKIRDLARAADLELSREEWYTLMEGAYGERLP